MKQRSQKRTLALCVFFALAWAPLRAHAGLADVLSLLTAITGTLRNAVGQTLGTIQRIEGNVNAFEQQTLWPITLINQAKTSVSQVRSQFSTLAGQIHSIGVSSATLANPSRLEALLRSASSQSLPQVDSSFQQVFLAVPQPTQATAGERDLIDADDALALSAMKSASLSDEEGTKILALADGLEEQAAASAPGSAVILSAQAQVAALENQAMLQKLLAFHLREEAAALSHRNALRKQSANANRELRNNLLHVLGRR